MFVQLQMEQLGKEGENQRKGDGEESGKRQRLVEESTNG